MLLLGLIFVVAGLVGGGLLGAMLFFIPAWVGLGPAVGVWIARQFPDHWLLWPACYGAGLATGCALLATNFGPMVNEPRGVCGLALTVGGGTMLFGWATGWWLQE